MLTDADTRSTPASKPLMRFVSLPPMADRPYAKAVMSPVMRTCAPVIFPFCVAVSAFTRPDALRSCSCCTCDSASRSSTMNFPVATREVVNASVRDRANSAGGGMLIVVWLVCPPPGVEACVVCILSAVPVRSMTATRIRGVTIIGVPGACALHRPDRVNTESHSTPSLIRVTGLSSRRNCYRVRDPAWHYR